MPFIESLNKKGIPYCVTGNYEQLPEFTSHDVDIWASNLAIVENILYNTARQAEFKVHMIYKTGGGSNNFFHRYEADDSITFVRIDLMRECAWKSLFTLVPGKVIKNNRIKFKHFFIPDFSVEAGMQLLYPLISGRRVKDKYKEHIFAAQNYPLFFEILSKSIGRRYADWLINLIKARDWNEIEKKLVRLRLQVIKQNIFNYFNVEKVLIGMKSFIFYIAKYIKPKGIFVVFIGADGCGKSTLCKNIPLVLKAGFMPRVKTFYWRPMLFPRIQKVLLCFFGLKSMPEDISCPGRHRRPTDNYLISAFKFVYYWFDFVLGSLKFHSVRAKGGIVLFDRYYYDFFVYPERFRLRLPFWFVKMFAPMVPGPDLLFYLQTKPEVLISRKDEVSLDELRRQTNAYLRVVSSLPNACIIDANQSLDKVVRDVGKIILNFMSQRTMKKYYENN